MKKCLSPTVMAFGVKTNKPPLFQMDAPFQVKHPLVGYSKFRTQASLLYFASYIHIEIHKL